MAETFSQQVVLEGTYNRELYHFLNTINTKQGFISLDSNPEVYELYSGIRHLKTNCLQLSLDLFQFRITDIGLEYLDTHKDLYNQI